MKSLPEVRTAYFEALAKETGKAISVPGFKFVYTPMHGVGLYAMKHAVENLGVLENIVVVDEQVSSLKPADMSPHHYLTLHPTTGPP